MLGRAGRLEIPKHRDHNFLNVGAVGRNISSG